MRETAKILELYYITLSAGGGDMSIVNFCCKRLIAGAESQYYEKKTSPEK